MKRRQAVKKSPKRTPKPVIFVDRDGVINEDKIGAYITSWKEFRFIPGAIEALKKLSLAGLQVVVVSNQAGVGDGEYSVRKLAFITQKMKDHLQKSGVLLRGIYYCLHGKNEGCSCRKPRAGLFEQAAKDIYFKPGHTFFVGDKVTDIQAGKAFGLRTIFVLTGHGKLDRDKLKSTVEPEVILPSLMEAADYALGHGRA